MWARLYVLRSNLGGIHNARNDADRKCNAPEGTFDSVSPWGLSSPVKKWTMEGGGRRHEGRRGRPLDVLVEWEGKDSDGGDLWEESWVSITDLSKDLREEARRLESELFGSRGTRPLSRRAERRNEVRQRHRGERTERPAMELATTRSGERGACVTPLLSSRNRGLTDGFH